MTGQVIPETLEIVAEYAVDLEFAFSVDTGANNLQPNILTFAFDDHVNNPLWATNIVTSPPAAGIGPQQIRSVRVRLATRTAEPDRTLDVAVPERDRALHVPLLRERERLRPGEPRRRSPVRARTDGDRRGLAAQPVEELLL